jgi:UDP-N-acetylglucosamine 2-epimerase
MEKTIELVEDFEPEGNKRNVFGDGRAAERIVEILVKRLELRNCEGFVT